MKNRLTILLICFFQFSLFAQINLVPNGSFEEYDDCPTYFSQPGDYQIEHCIGWYSPTPATSDYFNSCHMNSGSGDVGVPTNFQGYQESYDGEGYLGLYAYAFSNVFDTCRYTEYIQNQLISPLVKGHFYKVQFYVSLGENSTGALEHIGAYFSKEKITDSTTTGCPMAVKPQVFSNTGYLSDTINWMKIEGIFVASGGEKYITIGSFDHMPEILPVAPDSVTYGEYIAYYYLDALCCSDIQVNLPNVITPNSDGVNDQIDFQTLLGNVTYKWVVLNRWGNIINEGDQDNPVWSGMDQNNNEVKEGVYYYMLQIGEDKSNVVKSFIQLLR